MAVSEKVQGIISRQNTLNVLEIAELSKALQEAWDVFANFTRMEMVEASSLPSARFAESLGRWRAS